MSNQDNPKGLLIAVGGNEDKGIEQSEQFSSEFVEDSILARIVKEAGGVSASIIVITTASSIPKQVGKNYTLAFEKLGCKDVQIMDIRTKFDVKNQANIDRIKASQCVMFSGGDQRRLVNIIGDSEMYNIICDKYQNEKFVIAGTSAGAMAMSEEMIAGGSSANAMLKGSVLMMKGFGFMKNVIFDSHFINRGRFGRLTEAVARFPQLTGIGLAEDTGVVVSHGHILSTIGSGMVLIFDGKKLTHNNVVNLDEGTPISIGNMVIHVMANTDNFNLRTDKLTILTAEEAYSQGF